MVGWSAAALFRRVTDEERRDQRSGWFSVNERGIAARETERFPRAASIPDAILSRQRFQLFSGCSRTMTSLTRDGAAGFARDRGLLADDLSTRSGRQKYRPLSVAGAFTAPTTGYRPQEHRPSSPERGAVGPGTSVPANSPPPGKTSGPRTAESERGAAGTL